MFVGWLSFCIVNAIDNPMKHDLLFSKDVTDSTNKVVGALAFMGLIVMFMFFGFIAFLIATRK